VRSGEGVGTAGHGGGAAFDGAGGCGVAALPRSRASSMATRGSCGLALHASYIRYPLPFNFLVANSSVFLLLLLLLFRYFVQKSKQQRR
jgi:hypothetical protein